MASRSRERGFGAAFFIILIAAMSLAIVTLAERSGLAVRRADLDVEKEQARYLALAGAEQAIWRVQHEACFMTHSLGTEFTQPLGKGHYTYRVTGSDTDIRIAARGDLGAARYDLERRIERWQSPARAGVAYGRRWRRAAEAREYAAGAWGAPVTTATSVNEPAWCALRGAPTRRERLFATLDLDDVLQLQEWRDETWQWIATLSSDADHHTRCFDIAYEAVSGRGLVAYRQGVNGDLYYRLWDGTSLGPEQQLDLPLGEELRWVTLVPRPGSDEIALLAAGKDKQLVGAIWKGTGFIDVRVLDSDLDRSDCEAASAAFIDPTATLLCAWVRGDAIHSIQWRDGWSGATSVIFLGTARTVRLVSRPGNLEALLAVQTRDRRLTALEWKAGVWDLTTLRPVTLNLSSDSWRCFDLAFQPNGKALLVYGLNGSQVPWALVWSAPAGWAMLPVGGPKLGGAVRCVQLRCDPNVNLVHIGMSSQPPIGDAQLQLASWSGRWSELTVVSTDIPSGGAESYMLCPQGDVCIP